MSDELKDFIPQLEAKRIPVSSDSIEELSTSRLEIKKDVKIPALSEREKGYAFILNHEIYERDPTNAWTRLGTEKDAIELQQTMSSFKLKVVRHDNLTNAEIGEFVQQCEFYIFNFDLFKLIPGILFLVKTHNFDSDLCVTFFILTHGKANNVLLSADDEYNLYDFIIHPLVNANKTLLKKPKMFFIQACKGNTDHKILVKDTPGERPTQIQIETDGGESSAGKAIPVIAELLVCFATYEGHFAYRYKEFGTPFMQEFCKILKQRGHSKSIDDIILDVGKAVTNRKDMYVVNKFLEYYSTQNINLFINCYRIQVPLTHSTMTSKFQFRRLLHK